MTRRRIVAAAVTAAVAIGALAVLLWWLRRPDPAPSDAAAPATATAPAPRRIAPVPAAPAAPPPSEPVRLIPATTSPDDAAEHGVFAGRVVNWGTGAPVADADVTFERDGAALTVRSSDSGEFEFRPPAAGAYRLAVATAAGFLPYAPDWGHSPIEVIARPRVRIDGIVVYLSPAIDYRGTVVDPDGAPVASATVRLLDARAGDRALAPIDAEFTSDARGQFVFHSPDDALLEATHPAFAPGRARLDDDAQISHALTIRLGARGGDAPVRVSITGRVLDPAGDPVAEAMVRAMPLAVSGDPPGPGAGDDHTWTAQAVTGPDGRFALSGVDAGPYLVSATHDDYAPADAAVTATAGVADVTLQLAAGGFVRGRVIAGDGDPVPAFTIAVIEKPGPLIERVVTHASVFDGDGSFEIGGLRPDGDYWVRALAHGYAQSDAYHADVAPTRGAADPVDITLRRGGVLVGTVTDAGDGRPLSSAKVTVEGSVGQGPSALPTTATAITDDAGAFELAGLVPGRASVLAAAYDHHPRIVSGLQVTDGARLGPITIELTPLAEGEQPQIELAGIGAALGAGDDGLVVNQVIDGGGAAEVGLTAGDVITAVDGARVLDVGFSDTIQRIRGPVGSQVTLTVRRADGEVVDLVTTRRKIRA